jgi:hypothetical protein
MLFLPDSIIKAREKLWLDLDDGKIDPEHAYRQALALDPDDQVALIFLAQLRSRTGQRAEAEELLWRAVQAQPCAWMPYMELSILLQDQDSLSKGLAELACRKVVYDPVELARIAENDEAFFQIPEDMEDLKSLAADQKLELLADTLLAQRHLEPLAATARLHSLRLVHQLQEAEVLAPDEVDALVQEGESIVPLLVGALRGWVQDIVPEEDTWVAANSMAILGEVGDAAAIPYLLELVTLEAPELSGPCTWALDRIVEQHPDQAARVFERLAPKLVVGEKIAVAGRLLRYPQIAPSADLFPRLFENLEGLEIEDREYCFQILMSTAIMVLGRPGLEFARTMLRRHGALLSRKIRRECEEMIEEFGAITFPPRPPAEPLPWTVYDICGGNVDWEAQAEESMEEDDESLPPEPVRRALTPGRNDPCWCGSGRKYKKCHLDADEARH